MRQTSSFADFDLQQRVSCGEWLPERNALLFADSSCGPDGRRRDRVVLRDLSSGEERVITAGGPAEGNPVLSPDRAHVAFLSAAGGLGRQLYVWDLEAGTARRLTSMRMGVMDPLYSPDGKWLAFTSFASDTAEDSWLLTPADPRESAAWQKKHALDPIVIDDFGYKFDGLGFRQPEVMQLWVVPSDGSAPPRRVTRGGCNFMHAVFAPDSRHLITESNLYSDKSVGIAMDVLSVDIETGEIARVTEDRMVVSYPNPVRPISTPDGDGLVIGILDYPEGKMGGTYPSCTLYRVPLSGGEPVPLTEKTPECYDTVQFAYNPGCGRGFEKVRVTSDGRAVLFHAGFHGEGRIYRVPLDGSDPKPVPLTGGDYTCNGMGVPRRGRVLVARSSTNEPESWWLMDENTGEMEKVLQSNASWLSDRALSRGESLEVETLDGESRVHGWCIPPQNREDGRRYPAIVYVHGGPHPFYTCGFDLELQAFAGEGFGVICCNPRGSSGYGDVHRNLKRAYDGSAYTDILQFVSEACRRFDWIDPDRLGLTGGSYGGYMTNYASSRCSRFRAYITQRAVVNDLIGYASSDMQGRSKDYPTFGEFMAHEVEHSVICGMERVNAPFLIMHGMDDLRCPVEGAHQLFVALKDTHPEDFPIRMVLYPHCAHNQPSEPRQRKHYYRTMLEWFRKYL